MSIFKSIRFRLTFWYSGLLFIIASMFVLGLNIIVTEYYTSEPLPPVPANDPVRVAPRRWNDLAEEQRELIIEIRQEDLSQIRKLSILSLIPLVFISFGGGYIIATQMLRPIDDINRATKKIRSENLKIKLPHPGVDDELGELVNNFNQMLERLGHSFDLQTEFVENASHELKTPLAVIQTNLDTVVDDPKADKKQLKASIRTALKSVSFMNKLVEDLLLLSLQQAEVTTAEVNVVDVVNEVVETLKPLAKDKNVKVSHKYDDKENLVCHANSFFLTRAFTNLVENAIKYANNGQPEVNIETRLREDSLEVIISDNGPGIEEEDIDRVFDRFYRVDKSRSRKEGGSGLGLAIVKKIIEEHKGSVHVESEIGQGSTFIVSLPLAKKQNPLQVHRVVES